MSDLNELIKVDNPYYRHGYADRHKHSKKFTKKVKKETKRLKHILKNMRYGEHYFFPIMGFTDGNSQKYRENEILCFLNKNGFYHFSVKISGLYCTITKQKKHITCKRPSSNTLPLRSRIPADTINLNTDTLFAIKRIDSEKRKQEILL
jgi:hypothetical protein